MSNASEFHLVLALERQPNSVVPTHPGLDPKQAAALAERIAADLARLFPGIDVLDLSLCAVVFDPAQLLRPGWPVDAALSELSARAPRSGIDPEGGRVIAFGINEDGYPTELLTPDPALEYGPMVLMPLQLRGDTERLQHFSGLIETKLFDLGMAGAATALLAQDAFGIGIEHARYLTRHDLCAMTAMQYEHAGIGALWPLIESALFDPDAEDQLDHADLPPLRRLGRTLLIGDLHADDLQSRMAQVFAEPAMRAAAVRRWPARVAQIEAVLSAHGMPARRIPLDLGQSLGAISLA